jgi:chorismate lyase/3-hydroxybenzoate synthase
VSGPHASSGPGAAALQVDYAEPGTLDAWLARDDTLAVFGFGDDAPRSDDPRYLRVPLQPHDAGLLEIWRSNAPVERGRAPAPAQAVGDIAWAGNGRLSFGAIEVAEGEAGIVAAAEHAYARLSAFIAGSRTPHLLRIWNYIDAITEGEGDAERYRQFCVGRARGLGAFDAQTLPAATAIGRCDDARVIQIYWLSSAAPGTPVENPRQVSAYRYPRQYGPQAPSFARAMLPPAGSAMPLLLSGTASVVGHRSLHAGQLQAQLEETFANFDSLIGAARIHAPALPAHFGADSRLKVYVRERDDLPLVARAFAERFNGGVPHMILHAAICRRDLAVEIDGVHGTLPIAAI